MLCEAREKGGFYFRAVWATYFASTMSIMFHTHEFLVVVVVVVFQNFPHYL